MTEETCALPPISRPGKIILVEGKDEELLFRALLKEENLEGRIEIRQMGGRDELARRLRGLTLDPGRSELSSIGIVLDADLDAGRAFQKACDALRAANLPVPGRPLETATLGRVRTSIMIVPPGKPSGMLENLCLESVAEDPAMPCVDQYFQCLGQNLSSLPDTHLAKAHVKAFLVSRELLEESHFRFIQDHLETWMPDLPDRPSVEKVHAFLASRYNPKLDLGMAAEKRYWNLDHPAFDPIKSFLRSL